MNEEIKHAAVRTKEGWVFMGKQHADCHHAITNAGFNPCTKADSQGFVTNKGRYVDRKEGGAIAFKANQIDKPTSMLFSEDLWSPRHGGKYGYCSIRGYVLSKSDDESSELLSRFRRWWDAVEPFGYDHPDTRKPIEDLFREADNVINALKN